MSAPYRIDNVGAFTLSSREKSRLELLNLRLSAGTRRSETFDQTPRSLYQTLFVLRILSLGEEMRRPADGLGLP